MAQHPKLRKKTVGKSVYWFTKAGGETYFGNIDDVPNSEAKKLFNEHIKKVLENEATNKSRGPYLRRVNGTVSGVDREKTIKSDVYHTETLLQTVR